MPVKIRLARRGKKHQAFYHVVVADSRAPRDGKYIEKIGVYNPLSNPATIELDVEKALAWLQKGAQPSDTTKGILSSKGVMYKFHLYKGVAKGALTKEQADAKYEAWLAQKEKTLSDTKSKTLAAKQEALKKRTSEEAKKKEERAAKQATKMQEVEAAASAAEQPQADAGSAAAE